MPIYLALLISVLAIACTPSRLDRLQPSDSARAGRSTTYVQPTMAHGRVVFAAANHQLEIDPAGGRITRYALAGQNILNDQGGMHATGAVVWLAPQSAWPRRWPPPDALTHTHFDVALHVTGATFTSPPLPGFGVQLALRVAMTTTGHVELEVAMTALTAAADWRPWIVSRHRPGKIGFKTGPNGWHAPDGNVAPIALTHAAGWSWATVATDPVNRAIWADAAGQALYLDPKTGHRLTVHFPDATTPNGPEGESDLKLWVQKTHYVELETLAPPQRILPGMTSRYNVRWWLTGGRRLP